MPFLEWTWWVPVVAMVLVVFAEHWPSRRALLGLVAFWLAIVAGLAFLTTANTFGSQ